MSVVDPGFWEILERFVVPVHAGGVGKPGRDLLGLRVL